MANNPRHDQDHPCPKSPFRLTVPLPVPFILVRRVLTDKGAASGAMQIPSATAHREAVEHSRMRKRTLLMHASTRSPRNEVDDRCGDS